MSTASTPQTHEFQAEVRQVLDIVIHSLYTDREIFIRELVSNGSDALEKLRQIQITEKTITDDSLGLDISLSTDEEAGTITIADTGLGMTDEELVQNIGTIAHSGTKAFLQALKESGGKPGEGLIGQFGVGFYSVFMAADEVTVYTRSWKPDSQGYKWHSDGSGTYTIEPVEGVQRGTKIVAKLKEEAKEFATAARVKGILERYSSFIEFPISLNGEAVNTQQAIWLKDKADITAEAYKEFYKYQAKAFDDPLDWMHFQADAPLDIHALIYTPGRNPEMPGFGRLEPAVALYCRKVLIDAEPKKLLPPWLRFLKGVVDSADLPLNISRESMQDSALLSKIGSVLTRRYLKHLGEMAKKDAEKFKKFWKNFGVYIKEGVGTDYANREPLAGLLRFESSLLEAGVLTSLDEVIERMKEDQKELYFLCGPSRKEIESGPYLEAFRARGIEVLLCYEPIDDFVLSNLHTYKEKTLVNADNDELELGEPTAPSPEGEALPQAELDALCEWLRQEIGEARVKEVRAGKRLVDSPVIALNADKMMGSHMRRLMKMMRESSGAGEEEGGEDAEMFGTPQVNLEINPRHRLIHHLSELRSSDEALAKLVAGQIYDNALIAAGLLDNPRSMLTRLTQILENVKK